MTDFFCSVGGSNCQSLHLYAGQRGSFYVDAVLDDAPSNLGGSIVIQVGSLVLPKMQVKPANSGQFILSRSLRAVSGANGWGNFLLQKAYQDDSGVQPLTVAQDAARECGEVLGGVDFGELPLMTHYVRRNSEASLVLERLLENTGRTWWVDQSGITQIGTRPEVAADPSKYQVDTYSPLLRLATISLDDPGALWVGSVLTSDRLPEPQTIRDFELHVEKNVCRVVAFTGGDASDSSRLGRIFDALFEQHDAKRFYGKYRYRVFSMAPDGRANLQAVSRVRGLPDLLPVIIRPGAPGVWGDLVQGSEVFVEFEAGDPASPPMVTAFAGKGEPGFIPNTLELVGGGANIARLGDTGVAFFPPELPVTGTVSDAPFVGTITLLTAVPVQINSGSGKATCG